MMTNRKKIKKQNKYVSDNFNVESMPDTLFTLRLNILLDPENIKT